MCKGLREISQRLATGAGHLRVQSQVVDVTKHPLEDQSRFVRSRIIQLHRARERLDEPRGADVKRPLVSFKSVTRFFHVVAIDQTVRD